MSYAQPDPRDAGARPAWPARFARRTALGGSELTAILSLVGSPDTITFSGGFPAAETFPVAALGPILADLVERDPAVALQYTPTEGLASSRVAVAQLGDLAVAGRDGQQGRQRILSDRGRRRGGAGAGPAGAGPGSPG